MKKRKEEKKTTRGNRFPDWSIVVDSMHLLRISRKQGARDDDILSSRGCLRLLQCDASSALQYSTVDCYRSTRVQYQNRNQNPGQIHDRTRYFDPDHR